MNEHQLRNQFRGDISTLIEDMTQSLENEDLDPYSKERKNTLLEHHTRILFFDRLLTILGWRLGAKGINGRNDALYGLPWLKGRNKSAVNDF